MGREGGSAGGGRWEWEGRGGREEGEEKEQREPAILSSPTSGTPRQISGGVGGGISQQAETLQKLSRANTPF